MKRNANPPTPLTAEFFLGICRNRPLKGQCHEILCFWFFHESVSPKPLIIPWGPFRIFSKIHGDIHSSRFATGVVDRWCTLTCEYLREFSKKFEMVLREYSGAGGKLRYDKNQKQKISWHCPFKWFLAILSAVLVLISLYSEIGTLLY